MIYLDYSATTPVDSRVLEAMIPFFRGSFGNPSSVHRYGQVAESAVDSAREMVASILHCKPDEIIFTSCGSESDNLAIRGAAYATVIAGILPIIILGIRFVARDLQQEFATRRWPAFDRVILYQLIRFGMPAGLETFVNVGGFTFFTMVMYSYSADIAAATTIVLNWDMVSFLPLLGISQGTSSLVGKYLGAKRKLLAKRSAWSGLKAGWIYAGCITLLYFTATTTLVTLFSPSQKIGDYKGVMDAATVMLKISCLYFFFDATYSVLGGILKGAGDTVWTMLVSNTLMWATATAVYLLKDLWNLTPVGAWVCLTVLIFVLGILFFFRFIRGKWLHRLMIAES